MSERVVLSLDNIHQTYPSGEDELRVLSGVSMTLNAGEIVALVAPSGTGKSTLLHIAGLLERPAQGRITLAGRDVSLLNDAARSVARRDDIGFVYQFHHLLAEFSALENVMLPQRIAHVGKAAAQARAEGLLSQFGLTARRHHLPGRLSGGEKQRVAIARALANRPKVLLADEPTGNLDVKTSERVFESLLDVVQREKAAALIATHNDVLARRMHRVLTLRDGQLVAL